MKFAITYTFDSELLKRRLRCFIRHDWETYQEILRAEGGGEIVIAFKVCRRCAKSKLIHLLK